MVGLPVLTLTATESPAGPKPASTSLLKRNGATHQQVAGRIHESQDSEFTTKFTA
jgi:hypothetical protein